MSTAPGHDREHDRVIFVGLLGLAAATVTQVASRENLTAELDAAIYCFALAMPLLTGGLVSEYARQAGTPVPASQMLVGLVGILAALGGLLCLFLHFATTAGVVFGVGCVLAFLAVRRL